MRSIRGISPASTEGPEWATADYAVVLPADDLLAANALGRAARLLDAHPEVGLCYGREVMFADAKDVCQPADGDDYGWEILTGPEFLRAVASGEDAYMCGLWSAPRSNGRSAATARVAQLV